MDLTKPIPGDVVDGIRTDFDDIQFSASTAKVEVQWTNYSDPESTIEKYEVQVQAARYYKYNGRGVIKSPKRNGRLFALFGFLFIKSPKMKWETCCFVWFLFYQVTQNKMGDLLFCLVSYLSSHPK